MRTRVTPDPAHVKWINPDAVTDMKSDIVVTVGEGGGLFAVNRDDGGFLWARPFPYDTPDLNMNHIDVTTGATRVNVDKLFKQDGDTVLARIIRKGSDFGSQDGVIVSRTKDRTLPLSSAGHVGRKIGRMARCERPAGQLRRGRSREAR